ncbi:hypothetical protein HBI29_078650 [Parastagonospora nodorum]|nr:hypothetical protein HBI29_078650 [Parastagonospora nodorum]KAH6208444.1 hypothetical protein HBI53_121470 [Parastagonospora nodorum]KAH6542780.1 hypothetical protein HBI07_093580 [Parastagonospora nodorum]
MAGKQALPGYHCGMCDQQFTSKGDLTAHTRGHADNKPAQINCSMCGWPFEDSLSLEDHKIKSGHDKPRFTCENCGQGFVTPRSLEAHKKPPYGCSPVLTGVASKPAAKAPAPTSVTCDRCGKTFKNRQEHDSHRSFSNDGPCADHNHKSPPKNRVVYKDPDAPNNNPVGEILGYASSDGEGAVAGNTATAPSDLSADDIWCAQCRTRFKSYAQHVNHTLWCVTKHGTTEEAAPSQVSARSTSEAIQPPVSTAPQPASQTKNNRPTSQQAVSSVTFPCSVTGCARTCLSEAGLKQHKIDAHGIGGRGLDLGGKDSWMLNQRSREQMRQDDLLHTTPAGPARSGRGGARGGGGRGQGGRPPLPPAPRAGQHFTPAPIPAFGTPPSQKMPPTRRPRTQLPVQPPMQAPRQGPPPTHQHMPPPQRTHAQLSVQPPMQVLRQGESSVRHVGGVFEMEQAKHIQGKILRLLIQSDIFIRNDGKMGVCGIEWTRIGVEKQPDVPGMFEGMCHLPKILQGEYLPPPNTFKSDYQLQYPASEFEAAPARDRNKPGLGVVAIACSKVVLADGLQEVVKIAAVDVVTCRILMNHLICNNGTARVKNWRSDETGLYSWDDMEQARKLGYKIFKGWCAARSALSKFIDKDTIILGHDLRSDLDCLRMIHGRAVDIAKVAEKAAKGPLSKPQLSLDSLCRDFNGVVLKSDPEYGRDMLMNAFAVREMGLWLLKNKEEFEKKIRQKSSDYQRIMPRTAAA